MEGQAVATDTHGWDLPAAVKHWPTPAAANADQGQNEPDGKRGQTLKGAARGQLWNTPSTEDHKSDGPLAVEWAEKWANGESIPTCFQRLRNQVLYPTPTKQDSENNGGPSQAERNTPPLNSVVGGQLHADWVEWLMGWPRGWSAPEPVSQAACDAALSGHLWDFDPADLPADDPGYIPRLSSEEKPARRRARLQALGNGWVPQCAAFVLCAIRDALAQTRLPLEVPA